MKVHKVHNENMNEDRQDDYLNVRDTAKLLGVHENTVRLWVKNGTLASSKLPGARSHRFARVEVERLIADRGQNASAIAPQLRMDGPELIGPTDLDKWSARSDAKVTFPELIERLLFATPGVTNVNVRSHEGTAAHGWDGTAHSTGSSVLPAGDLYFELGTNEDPNKKATEDYAHRKGVLDSPDNAIFVFGTPRNWPAGAKWATEHAALGDYAGVESFDANRIWSWLRQTPTVHYWIS